jgi:hypothetical protein
MSLQNRPTPFTLFGQPLRKTNIYIYILKVVVERVCAEGVGRSGNEELATPWKCLVATILIGMVIEEFVL